MPVHELLGGAVRDRIPVYWSHCGLFRARYSHLFGKVIDAPPVRTLDDLRAAGREVAERGFKALKTNVLIFDKDGARLHGPGTGRGPGLPALNTDADVIDAIVVQLEALARRRRAAGAARGRPQFSLQAGGPSPDRQEGRAVRSDVARDGPLRAEGAEPDPTIDDDADRLARSGARSPQLPELSRSAGRRRGDHRRAVERHARSACAWRRWPTPTR